MSEEHSPIQLLFIKDIGNNENENEKNIPIDVLNYFQNYENDKRVLFGRRLKSIPEATMRT